MVRVIIILALLASLISLIEENSKLKREIEVKRALIRKKNNLILTLINEKK